MCPKNTNFEIDIRNLIFFYKTSRPLTLRFETVQVYILSMNTFFWTTGFCLHICHEGLVVAQHVALALSIQ